MVDMVRTFKELTADQQFLAGGKGGTLAQLHQAGYPVPDGFVILPSAFADDELKPQAWAQVQERLAHVRDADKDTTFAVRSSALSEDSALASFAGEFETVLDVRTDEQVRDAIRTVRHSRLSERVQAYSQAKGIDAAHEIAVVVQQLVRPEFSGVLFTADPVSGSRTSMMGNFIQGLGDRLVSGEADAQEFTLRRPKGQYSGPAELKASASALYEMGTRLEKDLGGPQDIEWAIADGKLHLLQSRPITTLAAYDPVTGVWNESRRGDYLWLDNGGIYPEPMTPSSVSLWADWFQQVQMAGTYMLAFIGNRLYANYSMTYSVARKVMRKSHEDAMVLIEVRLGPLPEGVNVPAAPFSMRTFLKDMFSAMVTGLAKQQRIKRNYAQIMATAPDRCSQLSQQIQQAQQGAQLAALWRTDVIPLFDTMINMLDTNNDDYFNPFEALHRSLNKLMEKDEASIFLSTLSGGGRAELATTGAITDLAKVASGEMSRQDYTHLYGHRHPNENELAVPRPKENPGWLDKRLADFQQSPVDVWGLMDKADAAFDAAWQDFQARYPKQVKKVRGYMDNFTKALHRRETIRVELTRSIGVMRDWFVRAGELTGLGDDIFFLTYQEALDVLGGDASATAYIPTRRERYAKLLALPPYPVAIRGRFEPLQWATDPNRRTDYYDAYAPMPGEVSASDTVNGVAGSAGRVEGVVRFLDSVEEGDQLQPGEILLASTTNVGWTPLFPKAAAVITDIGAPLSHAAIVARELGIPAVVGCGDATMRLKTGDRVLVDGGRGVVKILDSAH
jgi:phosphohistidine swiveling domain-containing protein